MKVGLVTYLSSVVCFLVAVREDANGPCRNEVGLGLEVDSRIIFLVHIGNEAGRVPTQ